VTMVSIVAFGYWYSRRSRAATTPIDCTRVASYARRCFRIIRASQRRRVSCLRVNHQIGPNSISDWVTTVAHSSRPRPDCMAALSLDVEAATF
jgi:hypothetical protein